MKLYKLFFLFLVLAALGGCKGGSYSHLLNGDQYQKDNSNPQMHLSEVQP